MATSEEPGQGLPSGVFVERRKRPRPGDRLPVPEVVDEGNSDADWALWQRSLDVLSSGPRGETPGPAASTADGDTMPMALSHTQPGVLTDESGNPLGDGHTVLAPLGKN